jgi:hypothetical protein
MLWMHTLNSMWLRRWTLVHSYDDESRSSSIFHSVSNPSLVFGITCRGQKTRYMIINDIIPIFNNSGLDGNIIVQTKQQLKITVKVVFVHVFYTSELKDWKYERGQFDRLISDNNKQIKDNCLWKYLMNVLGVVINC